MAAHSVPGETILPSSPSLPDPATPPQTESAVGASPYDRMQAEVKALQQQALATQASLKKLQSHESVDPVAAIVSDIPTVPRIDSTVVVVGAILLAALALVWWYLWRRPQTRQEDAGHTAMSDLAADSAYGQPPPPDKPIQSVETPVSTSPFTKPEPTMGFDSEAAASEVIRVRKSLAEKREARFLLLDQEGPAVEAGPHDRAPDPQPAMLDPWNMPGEGAYSEAPPSFDIDIHFTLPDTPDASDALPEPEPSPGPDDFLDAIELDFNIDEAEDPILTGAVVPDYATMLALAQVSEELEQLNEARDLAHEVMASDDPALRSEARALLDRLSEVESEMGPESVRWDDLR